MRRVLLEDLHPKIVDDVGDSIDRALRIRAIPRIVPVSERVRYCCNTASTGTRSIDVVTTRVGLPAISIEIISLLVSEALSLRDDNP